MKYIDFNHASVSQKKAKRLDLDKIYFDFKWMKYLNEVTTKTAKADDIAVSVLVITSSMISLRAIVPYYYYLYLVSAFGQR